MLSRALWLKIFKRYRRNILGMDANTAVPCNLKRCFFIGMGIGTGVVVSAFIAKKLHERMNNNELVLALNQVTHEIKELRVSMVQHFERTASAFSNEQALTSTKRKYNHINIRQKVLNMENEALPEEESSSDDDFYDVDDDEIKEDQSNANESLQHRCVLNFDELIKKCDELSEDETGANNEKEIAILEDLLKRHPDNVEVLMRFTRAYKCKANLAESSQGRKEAAYKGMEYGKRAVEINEDHPKAQKWYGIVIGIYAEVAPLTEKIGLCHSYTKHISKAIELDPDDSTNYHLLGRWCFEVANMSWWERQAAAALMSDPPASSYEEALSFFERAQQLGFTNPKTNAFYIGKCHQNLGDLEKGKEWLKKSLELPVKDSDDQRVHDEATVIMETL